MTMLLRLICKKVKILKIEFLPTEIGKYIWPLVIFSYWSCFFRFPVDIFWSLTTVPNVVIFWLDTVLLFFMPRKNFPFFWQLALHKKWSFSLNLQFPVDLVTFTEETVNGKLHFLRSVEENDSFSNLVQDYEFAFFREAAG